MGVAAIYDTFVDLTVAGNLRYATVEALDDRIFEEWVVVEGWQARRLG